MEQEILTLSCSRITLGPVLRLPQSQLCVSPVRSFCQIIASNLAIERNLNDWQNMLRAATTVWQYLDGLHQT